MTGGVAEPRSRTLRRAWLSAASIAAVATVAGTVVGIAATRLGWLPATGATPVALAVIALAACGAFAILACSVEIDSAIGRDAGGNEDRNEDRHEDRHEDRNEDRNEDRDKHGSRLRRVE